MFSGALACSVGKEKGVLGTEGNRVVIRDAHRGKEQACRSLSDNGGPFQPEMQLELHLNVGNESDLLMPQTKQVLEVEYELLC